MSETGPKRLRLDELLVARSFYTSRSRARDAILRGGVSVSGLAVFKPGQLIDTSADIEIVDASQKYVSRAALKLLSGLDHFALSPEGLFALDVGASTGGFVQVLLHRGALHVTGIDVGHGQMSPLLTADIRVTNIEGRNARELSRDDLNGRRVEFLTSDVSFISLKLALPPALELAEFGAVCLLLVKPQFEAGRVAIGKGGLLKDPTAGPSIAADLSSWLDRQRGWRAIGICDSPIEGADGNREFLLAGIKDR